ncbi:MAG: choice-of-anchor P family protein [Chloroflexia bacterium]
MGLFSGFASGGATAASLLPGVFSGDAFGTFANSTAGRTATTLGRSAYLATGCRGTGGRTITNSVTGVDAKNVLSARAIATSVYTNKPRRTPLTSVANVTGGTALAGASLRTA